ncbi:MAG: helix-turn-helix transcriptional regulator [Microbacterium sp.]|jgi:transcriptional regulator with XRE-family HTH domain|nr:helix-turn-helix transcriptional regulator [Microbacterium sp.]
MNDRSLFAGELDRAIRARGLTLQRLSRRLADLGSPVSVASLSLWRNGHRVPTGDESLEVVYRLEELLELDADSLARLLPVHPQLKANRHRSIDEFYAEEGKSSNTSELAERLDVDAASVFLRSTNERFDIGPDRQISLCRIQNFWEARVDRARSVYFTWRYDSPAKEPIVASTAGAQLGATLFDEENGTYAAEFILPRPLRKGETAITEYTFEGLGERDDVTCLDNGLARHVAEGSIWIQFTPGHEPTDPHLRVHDGTTKSRTPASLEGGALHHIVRGFGPGLIGFDWTWPPA